MTLDELTQHAQRFDRLRDYVNWSDDDARRIASLRVLVEPEFPRMIEDFYEMIQREPNAARVITGGVEQVERLKVMLLAWLQELFSGQYDRAYFERRWRVGWRHVEVGLEQVYADVALSRLRAGLTEVISGSSQLSAEGKSAAILSLNKLLDLDLTIIGDAYQAEQIRRQQQLERLLAIGQMAGGVAHELRNPLNVIKTSVYFLKHARSLTPEKLHEHLDRIERQVAVADDVITALNDFAKLPVPNFQPTDLRRCVDEVLEECRLNGTIVVTFSSTDDVAHVLADARQLRIVFGNLIRNARDAMPDGGELEITFRKRDDRIATSFRDSGMGISAEHLPRILEPMFSTKARGIGLGLPLARSILEKHDGKLEVLSQPGQGSTFVVWLPAAPAENSDSTSAFTS
jgi:signal transduction histidine kinase